MTDTCAAPGGTQVEYVDLLDSSSDEDPEPTPQSADQVIASVHADVERRAQMHTAENGTACVGQALRAAWSKLMAKPGVTSEMVMAQVTKHFRDKLTDKKTGWSPRLGWDDGGRMMLFLDGDRVQPNIDDAIRSTHALQRALRKAVLEASQVIVDRVCQELITSGEIQLDMDRTSMLKIIRDRVVLPPFDENHWDMWRGVIRYAKGERPTFLRLTDAVTWIMDDQSTHHEMSRQQNNQDYLSRLLNYAQQCEYSLTKTYRAEGVCQTKFATGDAFPPRLHSLRQQSRYVQVDDGTLAGYTERDVILYDAGIKGQDQHLLLLIEDIMSIFSSLDFVAATAHQQVGHHLAALLDKVQVTNTRLKRQRRDDYAVVDDLDEEENLLRGASMSDELEVDGWTDTETDTGTEVEAEADTTEAETESDDDPDEEPTPQI